MSLSENISKIKNIKKDLNKAISDKGISIQAETPFEEYPVLVNSINTSSADTSLKDEMIALTQFPIFDAYGPSCYSSNLDGNLLYSSSADVLLPGTCVVIPYENGSVETIVLSETVSISAISGMNKTFFVVFNTVTKTYETFSLDSTSFGIETKDEPNTTSTYILNADTCCFYKQKNTSTGSRELCSLPIEYRMRGTFGVTTKRIRLSRYLFCIPYDAATGSTFSSAVVIAIKGLSFSLTQGQSLNSKTPITRTYILDKNICSTVSDIGAGSMVYVSIVGKRRPSFVGQGCLFDESLYNDGFELLISTQTFPESLYGYLLSSEGDTFYGTQLGVFKIERPGSSGGAYYPNLTKFSEDGTISLSATSLPSSRYTDLTLGASGATYTAPANGYVYFARRASEAGNAFEVRKSDSSKMGVRLFAVTASQLCRICLPIVKGQTFEVIFDGTNSADQEFRFIYAFGESS